MSALFSTLLPSAPPPGSSYYVSNASIVAKRVALGLENPVRIQWQDWVEGGNPDDWCQRHFDNPVEAMQLRKEQKAPFFHEYISFRLRDGRSFRIDRRQLPNEQSPLSCIEEGGVEVYDTIEEIESLEGSMYSPSDCLVQLDFPEGIMVFRLYHLCVDISTHQLARFYTVQRYNCYFYAQTVLLVTLCWTHGWNNTFVWGASEQRQNRDPPERSIPLTSLKTVPDVKISICNKVSESYSKQANCHEESSSEPLPAAEQTLARRGVFRVQALKSKRMATSTSIDPSEAQQPAMQQSNPEDLQAYLSDMIHAHSARVEQYRFVLKCKAEDLERDIKSSMDQIWSNKLIIWPGIDSVE